VDIAFCGFVAGESFLKKSRDNSGWTTKYSFSLTEPDPITGLPASRVTNVMATLQKSDDGGNTWTDVQGPVALDTSTIVSCGKQTDSAAFCDGLGPVVDYLYYGNAGCAGNSAVFSFLHATCSARLAALTNDILSLAPDDFPNNNNNLCTYSQTAPFHVEFPDIAEGGDYRVHVTGTVKGNSAIADQTFTVNSSGNVTVNGCDPECVIPTACP
jgi:hypothetical protein